LAHPHIEEGVIRRRATFVRRTILPPEVTDVVKLFGLMTRKPGMTKEEFSRYWENVHAPLAVRLMPGVRRYTQTDGLKLATGDEAQFDGLSEMWFDDWDSMRRAVDFLSTTEDGRVLMSDMENFLDMSRSFVMHVDEERVLKGPYLGEERVIKG
jgi:uncharacterized protein (TIGR02118 family)